MLADQLAEEAASENPWDAPGSEDVAGTNPKSNVLANPWGSDDLIDVHADDDDWSECCFEHFCCTTHPIYLSQKVHSSRRLQLRPPPSPRQSLQRHHSPPQTPTRPGSTGAFLQGRLSLPPTKTEQRSSPVRYHPCRGRSPRNHHGCTRLHKTRTGTMIRPGRRPPQRVLQYQLLPCQILRFCRRKTKLRRWPGARKSENRYVVDVCSEAAQFTDQLLFVAHCYAQGTEKGSWQGVMIIINLFQRSVPQLTPRQILLLSIVFYHIPSITIQYYNGFLTAP